MTNSEIILQTIINLVQNAPAPIGNYWYLSFPKTFQEAVDENFGRFLKEDGIYHFAGNRYEITCIDYKF